MSEDTKQPEIIEATSVAPYAPAFDVKRFRQSLTHRKRNRDILIEWIRDSLQEGIDFGRLHVVKREVCQLGRNCDNPYHFSKPSLWKPGAEKICGMLGWTVTFPDLDDYVELAAKGGIAKMVILRCAIYNGDGQQMGEGIGARNLEKQDGGDINKSLKMAKKSAHIDATLVAAGLSEVFTQDMEPEDDPDEPGGDAYAPGVAAGDNAFERTASINLETHCTLGKWRGREWREVETGYLRWITKNIHDKPELVERAQRELTEREQDGPPEAPPQQPGSSDLAKHARALANAKTMTDIETAWEDTPEKYRPALNRTYDDMKTKIGESA